MQCRSKFILNLEEFERLCFEKGWNYLTAANQLNISREHLWKLTRDPSHPQYSRPGGKFVRNALKVFNVPASQLFFLDSKLRVCNYVLKVNDKEGC